MTDQTTLPEYHDILRQLRDRIGPLTVVNDSLAASVAALVSAGETLGGTQTAIASIQAPLTMTLDEIQRLDPGKLGRSLDAGIEHLANVAAENAGATNLGLSSLADEVREHRQESSRIEAVVGTIQPAIEDAKSELAAAFDQRITPLRTESAQHGKALRDDISAIDARLSETLLAIRQLSRSIEELRGQQARQFSELSAAFSQAGVEHSQLLSSIHSSQQASETRFDGIARLQQESTRLQQEALETLANVSSGNTELIYRIGFDPKRSLRQDVAASGKWRDMIYFVLMVIAVIVIAVVASAAATK